MSTDWYRHPDLSVRLSDPNEARIFLDDSRTWLPRRKPPEILLWDNTVLNISNTQNLSDEQAVEAAFVVLDEIIENAWQYENPPINPDGTRRFLH